MLYAKQMNVGTPTQVLSRALEPPDPDGIAKAVINLKEVNWYTRYMYSEQSEQLIYKLLHCILSCIVCYCIYRDEKMKINLL